ncbi:hypothetical protein R3W88_000206 [Solanum pinnatisectum]|uniref:Uncharacterized protein n=1 Tax=Solanum pinnatisectum TaxID=50273 RepID=A0AAV9MEX5_9SOLN|nr:hypothetical protein R3W88_000206 [Solanum pinnatisectum]
MKRASLVLWFCLFLISVLRESKAASQAEGHGVYIVYMGSKGSSDDHLQLMSSLTTRWHPRLSDDEAQSIAQQPGVVSVFPDPVFQPHTMRSWNFLRDQYDLVHGFPYRSLSNSTSNGADTIIGFLDYGIGPVPSRWKGTCTRGYDFNSSNCNRKLIGARFYDDPGTFESPITGTSRDHDGHGTHVAATAAGSPVAGASNYGLAGGTAQGGSPGFRIAAIMKAFDDAIAGRVDIINLTIGQPAGAEDEFSRNPIAIGAFHAVQKGIFAAGNNGPAPESVVNVAPWIFTGGGISFSDLKKSPVYPLMYSLSVKLYGEFVYDSDASTQQVAHARILFFVTSNFIGYLLRDSKDLRLLAYLFFFLTTVVDAILAAWPANDTEMTWSDQEPPLFNINSGTSMSCAHVSGIVATLKSQNPTWSLSAIRSAIMTTAFQSSNLKSPIIDNSAYGDQYLATPYDFSEGVATINGPLKPGLVYETEITDYLQFLCSTGYNTSTIKLNLKTLPNNFSCPANSSDESVSNMNYPLIAVSLSKVRETKEVTRTLTRIGDEESEYTEIIIAPDALRVEASPKKLKFTSNTKKLSYQVTFKAMSGERIFWINYMDQW